MKSTFFVIISLFFLGSCSKKNDDCETIQPPEPAINIRILDASGNSLIGEDNIYNSSEITLTRGDKTINLLFPKNNEETYITLYYPDMESDKDYQLKLTNQEIDFLNLILANNDGFCYDILEVEALYINGKEIQRDANYAYVIEK